MTHPHNDISHRASLTIALTIISITGCDDADQPELHERDYTVCSTWRCGYNTSEVNGKSVDELHLGGQPNHDGVRLIGFLPPLGLLYNWQLGVEGDALVATGGLFGHSTLRGNQLIGSTLLLQLDIGVVVPVIIHGHELVPSWASNGQAVHAYALTYVDVQDSALQHSVCKGTLVDPLQAAVVVLAGERYDQASKTVIPNQSGWITLACAGSAAAKMSLLGYGPHTMFNDGSAVSSVGQRQATLKMITADYCGDGHSYTVDGTPLHWENQSGTVVEQTTPGAIEAIWTADGAACLDTPRVVDPSEVSCALPSCDAFSLDDGEWATHLVAE